MKTTQAEKTLEITSKELDAIINKAINKVGGTDETDLCRYLPMKEGGYMHHFTLKRMRNKARAELAASINKHIISCDKPQTVAPKKRSPRGSRQRRESMALSRSDLEHILRLARTHGDLSLVRKLAPKRDFATVKRELISSIRHNRVESELWNCYCESIALRDGQEGCCAHGQHGHHNHNNVRNPALN